MTTHSSSIHNLISGTSLMLVLSLAGIVIGFAQRPEFAYQPPASAAVATAQVKADDDPAGHAQQWRTEQVTQRFDQAVAMLHAKQYDYAVTALHRVIELAPRMPEAYVNMGYALLGLERYQAAGDFFDAATEINPYQGNAYWGLALVLEKQGDLQGALGAMRTYIHLAKPNDPYVRKARSALWEWESRLKRGPLPKEEEEWLKQRGQQWVDRNSPDVDKPQQQPQTKDFFTQEAAEPKS